mgnify:CR=1 FL=1
MILFQHKLEIYHIGGIENEEFQINTQSEIWMNLPISLSNQKYGYASIFYGVSIILLAIFGKSSNTLLSISSSLLSLIATVGFLLTFFLKSDIDDERALDNLHRAGFRALFTIILLISILQCIVVFCRIPLDTDNMLKLILGISFLSFGYYFLYFERK